MNLPYVETPKNRNHLFTSMKTKISITRKDHPNFGLEKIPDDEFIKHLRTEIGKQQAYIEELEEDVKRLKKEKGQLIREIELDHPLQLDDCEKHKVHITRQSEVIRSLKEKLKNQRPLTTNEIYEKRIAIVESDRDKWKKDAIDIRKKFDLLQRQLLKNRNHEIL